MVYIKKEKYLLTKVFKKNITIFLKQEVIFTETKIVKELFEKNSFTLYL